MLLSNRKSNKKYLKLNNKFFIKKKLYKAINFVLSNLKHKEILNIINNKSVLKKLLNQLILKKLKIN